MTDEEFFLGRVLAAGTAAPTAFTAAEEVDALGSAWVSWSELGDLADPVEPDLLPVLNRLSPDRPWAG